MNALGGGPLLEVSSSEASIETQLNCFRCFVTAAAVGRIKLFLLGLPLECTKLSWLLCII